MYVHVVRPDERALVLVLHAADFASFGASHYLPLRDRQRAVPDLDPFCPDALHSFFFPPISPKYRVIKIAKKQKKNYS